MALRFQCKNCGEDIIVRYLKPGETAKCKKCAGENIVPNTAEEIEETVPSIEEIETFQVEKPKKNKILREIKKRGERELDIGWKEIITKVNNLLLHQKYKKISELIGDALEAAEASCGLEHPSVGGFLKELMTILNREILERPVFAPLNYAEAEPLLRQMVTIQEILSGCDSPEAVRYMEFLARVWNTELGKPTEAEKFFLKVLQIKEKTLGRENLETMQTLKDLGFVYYKTNRYEESESLCKEVISFIEKTEGLNSPMLIDDLCNLATIYEKQGKDQDAEEQYKRALSIAEKSRPRDISYIRGALGSLFEKMGKDEEAKLLKEAASDVVALSAFWWRVISLTVILSAIAVIVETVTGVPFKRPLNTYLGKIIGMGIGSIFLHGIHFMIVSLKAERAREKIREKGIVK